MLAESLSLCRELVAASALSSDARAGILWSIGEELLERGRSAREVGLLDEAIRLAHDSLAVAPPGGSLRPVVLTMLGEALRWRLEHNGDNAGLEASIEAYRNAIRSASPGADATARERAAYALCLDGLADLGDALAARFHVAGDSVALDTAIHCLWEAVNLAPADHAGTPAHLCNLGVALVDRFKRLGDVRDLERAVDTHRQALDRTPPDDRARAWRMAALAIALAQRSVAAGGIRRHMEEAMELAEGAAAAPPGDQADSGEILANLGVLFAIRSRLVSVTSGSENASREAVVVHGGEPVEPRTGSEIDELPTGVSLWNGTVDLDRGVETCRRAVAALPPESPQRAHAVHRLGLVLRQKWDGADGRTLLEAAAAFEGAARSEALDPLTRVEAAQEWAELSAASSRWRSASEAYHLAVASLAQVAPTELRRTDQEHRLSRLPGLASDAAAAVLRRGGEAVEALELLERGRGLLLTQAMLSSAGGPGSSRPDAASDQLLAATGMGPVVAVNVSPYGCDALLVHRHGVEAIRLPDLTHRDIDDRVASFNLALEICERHSHQAHRTDATKLASTCLEWLWDVVASPVLDALAPGSKAEAGEPLPRLWWMPTGMLSFLPVHAAGYHGEKGRRTVIDRVVPSYTPTLRALRHAGSRPSRVSGDAPRPLVVAVSKTAGYRGLPGVLRERDIVVQAFPQSEVLVDRDATPETVNALLAGCDWVHFACHASSSTTQPSASHLVLTGGFLSVADIVQGAGTGGRLAYLSACSTARASMTLTDEAIHMGSAFQLAGFQHVVATLWPVDDQESVRMVKDVYADLSRASPEWSPARAVHAAVRKSRHRSGARNPFCWASHIHSGP